MDAVARPAEADPALVDLARAVHRDGRVVLPDGRVASRGRKVGTVAIGRPPRPFPERRKEGES